jgi:small redox-active disulfide protein 2
MKIEILGPGCARCETLASNTRAAADGLGLEYSLEKVTDITAIAAKGVMMTPALIVDGELKISGKVPSVKEIKSMISQ